MNPLILAACQEDAPRHPRTDAYRARLATHAVHPTGQQLHALNAFFRAADLSNFARSFARLALPVWGNAAANAIDVMHPAQSMIWVGTVSHGGKQVRSPGRNGYLEMQWNPHTSGTGTTANTVGLLAICPNVDTLGVIMGSRATTDLLLDNYTNRPGWFCGNPASFVATGGYTGMNVRFGYGNGTRTKLARLAPGASILQTEADYIPTGSLPNANVFAMAFNAGGAALHNDQPFRAMAILHSAINDPMALAIAIALDRLVTALRA